MSACYDGLPFQPADLAGRVVRMANGCKPRGDAGVVGVDNTLYLRIDLPCQRKLLTSPVNVTLFAPLFVTVGPKNWSAQSEQTLQMIIKLHKSYYQTSPPLSWPRSSNRGGSPLERFPLTRVSWASPPMRQPLYWSGRPSQTAWRSWKLRLRVFPPSSLTNSWGKSCSQATSRRPSPGTQS
jgi:hypothetical protein